MKENKSIFLKVDCVEPILKGGGICSRETYLDGVHVDSIDSYLEV